MLKKLPAIGATIAFACCSAGASAGQITSAVGAVINAGGPGSGAIANTYNQSGLDATYTSGVTDFASFVATTKHTYVFENTEWFSNLGTTSASVTYDLGAVKRIDALALWNEESSGVGVYTVSYSSDGSNFQSLLPGVFPTDHEYNDYTADVFAFAAVDAQYVRLDMASCPQQVATTYDSCALGEVAFSVSAVPEPEQALMLPAGLLMLAAWRARRNRGNRRAA